MLRSSFSFCCNQNYNQNGLAESKEFEKQQLVNQPLVTEHIFKIIIIGDSTVGKTSFVRRYVQRKFERNYKATVGVDFALKCIKWSDTENVKLQLWDIAGQDNYAWLTRVYYKDAQGAILLFDLNNRRSFLNCLKWKEDIDSKCRLPDGSYIPCLLLANKCDLPKRKIKQMEIEHIYKNYSFLAWTEISVKEGLMVEDAMTFLVHDMLKRKSSYERNIEESIKLTKKESKKPRCLKC